MLRDGDRIELKGCRFFSHIGYFDFEQEAGQNFVIDLTYTLGRPEATENDDLEDTLSYADVYETLREFMEQAHHRLIERAAQELSDLLLQTYPQIDALELTLKKPEAPIDGPFEHMAFTVTRRRWTPVGIALGANLGDAKETLFETSQKLHLAPEFRRQRISSLYRSKAWGVEDQPDFYNAVLLAETTLSPWQLLSYLKDLEKAAGRTPTARWGPRILDCDLLFYEGCVMNHPKLTLPHPRMEQRSFVMVPLREVRDGLVGEAPDLERVGPFPPAAVPHPVESE